MACAISWRRISLHELDTLIINILLFSTSVKFPLWRAVTTKSLYNNLSNNCIIINNVTSIFYSSFRCSRCLHNFLLTSLLSHKYEELSPFYHMPTSKYLYVYCKMLLCSPRSDCFWPFWWQFVLVLFSLLFCDQLKSRVRCSRIAVESVKRRCNCIHNTLALYCSKLTLIHK